MATKIPQLHFDADVFRDVLKHKFMDALEEFEDQLIEEMQFQIDRNGNYSGEPEWRENLKADLKNLDHDITDEIVWRQVGVDIDKYKEEYEKMRALVIAYGTGYRAKGGGEPMRAKPGEMVWNHNLSEKFMSEAKSDVQLPDSWNRPPTDFVDVAVLNLRKEYERFIDMKKDGIVAAAMKESLRFE